MHYFYINNSKTNEKLKEYGFVISKSQNIYLQHVKNEEGRSEAELIRKIVDLVLDKDIMDKIETLNINENVSDIRKNVKFTKSQLSRLEQITNVLNKTSSPSSIISKAEVIRRLINFYLISHNYK